MDGFKMVIPKETDQQLIYDRNKARKDLRKLTSLYATSVLKTNVPDIKSTIRDYYGDWANVVKHENNYYVICRSKKHGGHVIISPEVFKYCLNNYLPIIVYVNQPSKNREWVFYKFSPLAIEEEIGVTGGTYEKDRLLWFRIHLGISSATEET